MGCLDKLLNANCKIILILVGMVLFFIWCNVGFVILVIRNYLNHELYHLDLYIQIPSDCITLLILNFLGHRLICDVARDHPESWSVTVQLFKDFLSVILRCGFCRSGRNYARAHELHFGFANQYKCPICWDPYDAQTPQYLLHCGHRFHQCCLDKFESQHSIYHQLNPNCRMVQKVLLEFQGST